MTPPHHRDLRVRPLLAWLAVLAIAGCGERAPVTPPMAATEQTRSAMSIEARRKRFDTLVAEQWEFTLRRDPEFASRLGDRRYNDQWPDASPQAIAADLAETQRFLDRFQAIDPTGFPDQEALSHQLMVRELRLKLEAAKFERWLMPVDQFFGIQVWLAQLVPLLPFETVKDYDDYIARLTKLPAVLEQNRALMQLGLAKQLMPPRFLLEQCVGQAQKLATGGDTSPFAGPLARFPASISQAEQARIRKAVVAAIRDQVEPAFAGFAGYLRDDYAPHGRSEIGLSSLPDGVARYAFQVKENTSTELSFDQIHQLGLAEVARIEGEQAAIAKRLGFADLAAFRQHVRTDRKLYATSGDQLLARYRRYIDRMYEKLPEMFGRLPRGRMKIEPTEAFREKRSSPADYASGSPDGARPGLVHVNTYDPTNRLTVDMEAIAYHEGVPGHHLQIAIQQELGELPAFRQQASYNAFQEGWGLYAERLGKDMGFYQDPYSDLGRLTGELWRACRLVVDSGLHYKHWTREAAIRYLQENSAAPDGTIVREVDRYIAVPGQATAFTVGMLKFVAERERARKALGARFDLREYHHVVLENGYLPLWAMEDWVSRWIGSKQVAAAPPPQSFSGLLGAYWADWLRLNPALALTVGDYSTEERFDESLEDTWRARVLERLKHYSVALAGFDPARLGPDDRVSYGMLRYRLDQDLGFYGGHLFEVARMLPIDQFQGLHIGYAAEAAGSGSFAFKTATDYDKALVRADNYSRWADDVIQRLREGVAAGVVLPRIVVERMLPQLHAHLGIPPEKTQFWHPVEAFPSDVGAEDRARLTAAYRVKITAVIQPAYQRLYDYLSGEYLSHARPTDGLAQMPGGRELYSYYVRYHTTTDMTPAQIHALGVSEVQRITSQLAAVQESVHFKGTLHEFLAHVRDDPTQHFSQPEEVVPAFEAARQQIVPKLPALFDVLPRAPYEIRALPESSRNSLDNGYFAPAAADGSRPGILWVNIYASGVRDKFNVMTISLHEGLPGHHLQTSVAQERTDLPSFRRFDSTNAYVEGWGLYAETLGQQMGFYAADPSQYYGHLNYAMLRANRLVVDTGIHAEGWSVAQAVHWMTDHSSMSEAQATAEVERYVAYPGQALSYKIGEQKILELRERAQQKLGARFDIRAFHDQILLGGSMPLAILEEKVDRWLASAPSPSPSPSSEKMK